MFCRTSFQKEILWNLIKANDCYEQSLTFQQPMNMRCQDLYTKLIQDIRVHFRFYGVYVDESLVSCVAFVDRCLFFFVLYAWPLYCLSFDWLLLTTPVGIFNIVYLNHTCPLCVLLGTVTHTLYSHLSITCTAVYSQTHVLPPHVHHVYCWGQSYTYVVPPHAHPVYCCVQSNTHMSYPHMSILCTAV